jgi:uncharacterized Zn-binding protein involved in type VI secretion
MHACPLVSGVVPHVGGPISLGAPTVLIGSMPAARVGDLAVCVGPPDTIAMGSTGVMIAGMPAARMGDLTAHGGTVVMGFPTVLIGEVSGGAGAAGGGGGAAGGAAPATGGGAGGGGTASSSGPVNKGPLEGLSRQANALLQAGKDNAPFCEECGDGKS